MAPPTTAKNGGLYVTAYCGDGAILLGFDLDEDLISNLAGFAIQCQTPSKGPYLTNKYWLPNMLGFQSESTPSAKPSNLAPFQTFHWVHFPSAGPGQYTYTVYAAYFGGGTPTLKQSASMQVDLQYRDFANLEIGFTRGYVSSQAYADRFHNEPIQPPQKSIGFDTSPYLPQYEWLGAHGRKLVFDFLAECKADPSTYLDVFAYDFNEPDVIREIAGLGNRVRLYQDNAALHVGANALEPETVRTLQSAGAAVKLGHFLRFAHDKVMIQKKDGVATKVLTGSANFSIRGLYVQANSVLVFDDPVVAGLYEQAFSQAFTDAGGFSASPIASHWYDVSRPSLPPTSVSFAPHSKPFSLQKVADAITKAKSSVLFAVMELSGSGPVMSALESLGSQIEVFAVGTIQQESELKLFKPGTSNNVAFTSFSFLQKNVPAPFRAEWGGGAGQVIHHKFVVCDFNGTSPVVFCGSSNLASGGEQQNGDNLIAIADPEVATLYAVEALRLFDHYNFRRKQENATADSPFVLDSTDGWAKPYYDENHFKSTERTTLAAPGH